MKYLILIFSLLCSTHIIAQSSKVNDIIKQNSYSFSVDYKGAGMDFLLNKGQEADYFLIGEDHGIAEVAKISEALFIRLNKEKYNQLVIETGFFTAKLLTDLLRVGDDKNTNDFFKKHPFSIPFYSVEEESKFLKTVLKLSNSNNPILGIDQEFILSPRILLDRHKNEFQPAIVNEIEVAKEGYKFLVAQKSPEKLWLTMQTPQKWEVLNKSTKSQAGARLIKELKESLDIYNLNFQNKGQESNELRVKKFIQLFEEQSTPDSKTMIKMGASHVMKGTSFYGVEDIGDYLSKKNPGKTFHVAILPVQGYQNMYIPFRDESAKKTKISNNFSKGIIDLAKESIPETGYLVIDVSSLRKHKELFNTDPALEKVLSGFDAIILIPNCTPNSIIE